MDTEKKLLDLVNDFDSAMLVTKTDDGELSARPMAVAEVSESGELWFMTDRNSGKIADLMLAREVAVTMQGPRKFVSIAGHARVIDDPAKIQSLWQESWKIWFPEGKHDPAITLLKVEPERGEYWDHSGMRGVKYLIKAGKAYLQGERPEIDSSMNAAVSLD